MSPTDPAPAAADSTPRQTAFSSLRHRDFRLLWIGQIVSVIGSQMQLAAINWHIYILTRSALALGLVGACRAVLRWIHQDVAIVRAPVGLEAATHYFTNNNGCL